MTTTTAIQKETRMLYIDNIRVFLTILVVLHHMAITYGSGGGWYYFQHTSNETLKSIFSNFTSFNQSYFMGFFFLIAGFFTPGAFDRKGSVGFIKDRLVRLGIPLFIFFFTISPWLEYIKAKTVYHDFHSFWEFYRYNILVKFNLCPGPLWFVETLLVFSAVYAGWRLVFRRHTPTFGEIPLTQGKILGFMILLSLLTFVSRLAFPVGQEFFHLQLSFFAQYIGMFVAGIIAYRHRWLQNLTGRQTAVWSIVTGFILIVAGVLLPPWLSEKFSVAGWEWNSGAGWPSLYLSAFHGFVCPGMCIILLYIFRRWFNSQGSLGRFLASNAFTVYIIHAPVIVFLAYELGGIALDPLVKFIIVSILGVAVSFAVSHWLIRSIPYAKRVL